MTHRALIFCSVAVTLLGCKQQSETSDDNDTDSDSADLRTYTEDIRPLLSEYCIGCHQEGGAGPFALDSYEDASAWAPAIANSVRARRMPPYFADASGDCGTFRDSKWLNDAQIESFELWADDGAEEGDPDIAAPPPRPAPQLTGEIRTVDIGSDYLPDQSQSDDYRCFVVESPGAMAVSGFNVVPGNPRIVHHLIAYQAVDDDNADEARRLDEEAEGPGYSCLGTGPMIDATSVAAWAPGAGAELYPEGIGVELDANLPLILEIHYNVAGGPGETDRTVLELQREQPGSLRPLLELIAIDEDFVGEPGQRSFVTTDDLPISWQVPFSGTKTLQLLGANGHMHKRGISQRVERVTPSGEVECLLEIPSWDYDWQLSYWYDQTIEVSSDDSLRITCEFDTTDATAPVTWGDGTDDEMCLASVFAVAED